MSNTSGSAVCLWERASDAPPSVNSSEWGRRWRTPRRLSSTAGDARLASTEPTLLNLISECRNHAHQQAWSVHTASARNFELNTAFYLLLRHMSSDLFFLCMPSKYFLLIKGKLRWDLRFSRLLGCCGVLPDAKTLKTIMFRFILEKRISHIFGQEVRQTLLQNSLTDFPTKRSQYFQGRFLSSDLWTCRPTINTAKSHR